MMSKLPLNQQGKEKSGFLSLNPASKTESVLLAFLILLLPTQFGKHFWPSFSLVDGIRIDYLSPTLYVTDILIGFLLIAFLVRTGTFLFRNVDKETFGLMMLDSIGTYWYVIPITAFFFYNVLFAPRIALSAYYFLKLLEYTFFALYIAKTISKPSQLFTMSLLFVVSMFFESFLAILQYLNQGALMGWLYYFGERAFTGATPGIANASLDGVLVLRPYGTFSHPNVLAGYLLLSTLFTGWFGLRHSRGFIRAFFVFVLLLASIALFLSLSRVAIIVWFVVVCSLLIGMIFKEKSYRKSMSFAIVVGLLISFVLLPFSQTIITRFAESSLVEEAFVQRAALISNAFVVFLAHPLTGVGLGNFIPALSPLQPMLTLSLYLQPVHVIYLLLAAETGVIGLGIFLWFLVKTYRNIFSQKQIAFGVYLTAILSIGFFDHYFMTLQQGQLFFALVLGLCWAKLSTE